jgi:NAD(P)-dependent dehydrogenase (short-subunit alcohol dehydrogenase family)
MPAGSSIVYNASINMAVGHPELLDYTATKGAMIAFMRGLSNQIVGEKGIRVNGKSSSLRVMLYNRKTDVKLQLSRPVRSGRHLFRRR